MGADLFERHAAIGRRPIRRSSPSRDCETSGRTMGSRSNLRRDPRRFEIAHRQMHARKDIHLPKRRLRCTSARARRRMVVAFDQPSSRGSVEVGRRREHHLQCRRFSARRVRIRKKVALEILAARLGQGGRADTDELRVHALLEIEKRATSTWSAPRMVETSFIAVVCKGDGFA